MIGSPSKNSRPLAPRLKKGSRTVSKLLIDTSVIIDFFRVKNKLDTLLTKIVQSNEDLYASIITHTELYAGRSIWSNENAKQELEALLSGITVIALEKQISRRAGEIKAENNIDLIDAIIAATAIDQKMELVTLNLKDFKNVKTLKIYKYSR